MTTRNDTAAPRKDGTTGTWWFVVDLPPGPDGRRRQAKRRGFATKREAQAELDKLRVDARQGTIVELSKMRVGDYLTAWVGSLPAAGLEASTVDSYARNLRLHVVPAVGGLSLQALTPLHLDKLYADLLAGGHKRGGQGLSARSVRYIHTICRKAFADATRKGLLVRNPADAATPPSAKSARAPEMMFWTPEQLRTFLGSVGDDDFFALYRLAAMTGLRRGEVCGLRWSDVDLDEGTVSVRWQLVVTNVDGHGRRLVHKAHPKSDAGIRVVNVDPATVDALRGWKAQQARWRLAVGEGWADTGLVFTRPDGAMLHPERVAEWFTTRCRHAGLDPIRFHDLRHTHCAHLIATGQNIKLISRRMGHASVSFTLDRYGHLLPEQGGEAALAVAGLVDGAVA